MSNFKAPIRHIAIGLLLLAPAVASADGRITLAQGNTAVVRTNETVRGERGTVLRAGDRVQTGRDGDMQLWLQDDSVIVIGPDSRLQLTEQDSVAKTAEFSFEQGSLRMIPGAYQPTLKTGMADIKALGTDFTSVICATQCGSNAAGLYIKVDSGAVVVSNAAGSVQANAGQFAFAASVNDAPRIIAQPQDELPLLMARLRFDLELLDFNVEVVVLPTLPDLPVDPSPSLRP